MFKIILACFTLVFSIYSYNISGKLNCEKLPKSFTSYAIALKTIKASHFKIEQSIKANGSSWILGASFLSCDSKTGFLIIKTERKEYIHSNVPTTIWKEFKKADSFGSYYNHNIKHKYYFKLK